MAMDHSVLYFCKYAAFVVIAAISSPCFTATPCDRVLDHVSQRTCSEYKATQAAKEVVRLENAVRRSIEAWAQDKDFRVKLLSEFNNAASSYAKYKADACELDRLSAAGGNGAGDMALSCAQELDQAYILRLQQQEQRFKN